MSFGPTSIISVDPHLQFLGAEHALWLRDRPLAMYPLWFDRVQPRTLARQQAHHQPHAHSALLDYAIVEPYPGTDLVTLVPRGVVPDQQQAVDALHSQPLARPGQKIARNRTDWTPSDKAQQHLVGLLRATAQQQPIAGQSLGIGVVLGPFEFLELCKSVVISPAMLIWLGQSAPPDFISKAERPGRVIGC